MEKLVITARRDSPDIIFDSENGIFSIIGVSHPENVTKFFEPVMAWLDEFEKEIKLKQTQKSIKIVFYFKYFNSATYKYLLTLLQRFQTFTEMGVNFHVEWRYERDDEEMRESGIELFDFSGIKIPYQCIESEEL